jgi:hypothetical protein
MTVQSQTPNGIEAIYPMSPMQQGILLHSIEAPDSGVYCVQSVYTLSGELDEDCLERSWQAVVSRHAILRTAFILGDEPVQVVFNEILAPIVRKDWRREKRDELDSLLREYLVKDRQLGFQPTQAPLMRLALLRTDECDYQLVWTYHHVLIDGWSAGLVFQEVAQGYEASRRGRRVDLAEDRERDKGLAEVFWRGVLEGFEASTPLPGAGKGLEDLRHEDKSIELSEPVSSALARLAAREHLTIYSFIQATWGLLISRYAGKQDVVFGSVESGRPESLPGVEGIIGLFINTLPVRLRIDPERGLLDWVHVIHDQQTEARQYAFAPLTDIHSWSDVPRGQPLFEMIVGYQNFQRGVIEGKTDASETSTNLIAEAKSEMQVRFHSSSERTNYPLAVQVVPGRVISIRLTYDGARYSSRTIEQLLDHWQRLLESAV